MSSAYFSLGASFCLHERSSIYFDTLHLRRTVYKFATYKSTSWYGHASHRYHSPGIECNFLCNFYCCSFVGADLLIADVLTLSSRNFPGQCTTFPYGIFHNHITRKSCSFSFFQNTDMLHVYTVSDTLQKREFVKMVFDSNLYYEKGIYRTPNAFFDVFR